MGNKAVKTPLGMVSSYFFPFASEPVGTHPVYGDKVDMGAAVKGYLSLTTASGDITGDDAMLLYFEQFVSGQVDVETTLSDLEVNAKLYGHSYKAGRETAKGEDSAPNGAYAFIEPILKKDKTLVYRASFFYKVTAMLSAEKQEADTRKSDFNPKMPALRRFCVSSGRSDSLMLVSLSSQWSLSPSGLPGRPRQTATLPW